MIELFLAFAYCYIYYSTVVDRKVPLNIFGICLGGLIITGTIAFGPYTGASVNIVRTFGPSIITGNFHKDLILMIANLAGGFFGGYYCQSFKQELSVEQSTSKSNIRNMKNPENINQAMNLKYWLN